MHPGRLETELLEAERLASDNGLEVRFRDTQACPLLKLQVRLEHPAWRLLGWAAGVELEARDGNRQVAATRLLRLDEDRLYETFFALAPEEELVELFDPGGRPRGPRFDALRLSPESGGPFGVQVRAVDLGEIRCVRGVDR